MEAFAGEASADADLSISAVTDSGVVIAGSVANVVFVVTKDSAAESEHLTAVAAALVAAADSAAGAVASVVDAHSAVVAAALVVAADSTAVEEASTAVVAVTADVVNSHT